jgi:hypothetical protein
MPLGLGLSPVQLSSANRRSPRSIVAFGDSLTAGAGSSSAAHCYPAIAAALFYPPRDIINKGIGEQTSTQIATRQGGLPLLLAVQGDRPRNLFPHTRDWTDLFEPGTVNGLKVRASDVARVDFPSPATAEETITTMWPSVSSSITPAFLNRICSIDTRIRRMIPKRPTRVTR